MLEYLSEAVPELLEMAWDLLRPGRSAPVNPDPPPVLSASEKELAAALQAARGVSAEAATDLVVWKRSQSP